MAIDTPEKRRSASALLPALPPSVTPDAVRGAVWRQNAAWGYLGIPAGEPVAAVPRVFLEGRAFPAPLRGSAVEELL